MGAIDFQQTERQARHFVGDVVQASDWVFRECEDVSSGVDAYVEPIVEGRLTGRMIGLQIESGLGCLDEREDMGFVYRGEQRQLDDWREQGPPVMLLLVDLSSSCIYWVRVGDSQVIPSGDGWKIVVPYENVLDARALEEWEEFASPLTLSRPYTRLQLEDVSHANAKRYSASILLNRDFSKEYIRSLASEITKQLTYEDWLRTPQLGRRFEGHRADVVWLFLCRDVQDAEEGNWLCRTQWISPDLAERFRPTPILPGLPAGEVGIVWQEASEIRELLALERELSRGEALNEIGKTIKRVDQHMAANRGQLDSFLQNPLGSSSAIALLRKEAVMAHELYFQGGDFGKPPLELSGLMTALDSVLASYDRVFLLFAEELEDGASLQRTAVLAADSLRRFDEDRVEFREEAKREGLEIG